MQKWEHAIVEWPVNDESNKSRKMYLPDGATPLPITRGQDIASTLQEMGKDGWELVAADELQGNKRYFLKRQARA